MMTITKQYNPSMNIAIHWFRQDLRLSDNPALFEAAKATASDHQAILPIYILDDDNAKEYAMGSASRCWLHHSLHALNQSLDGKLSVFQGDPIAILTELSQRHTISAVYWNRCYEPWRIQRDKQIKNQLIANGISAQSFNGSLLWEPWEISKADATPYKVFTPYFRRGCLAAQPPRQPLPAPPTLNTIKDAQALTIEELQLLPQIPWDASIKNHWQMGEQAAQQRLNEFIASGITDYKEGRNLPSKPFISRLSAHLHFGEISPNQCWYTARAAGSNDNIDHFCSELGWREFSHSQLYYNPELPKRNLRNQFDSFPWVEDATALLAWQQGKTGIPFVDAGMRELWQTGYMHNRVRMVAASFLVKNLLIDWRKGERWFWDTLVDADLANNSASWQWVAGCGADAAPYFRIFNPVTQGQRFDKEGDYTKKYLPELAKLPNKYLFNPWEAPKEVLDEAGVELGVSYPAPIVDLKISRTRALEALAISKEIFNAHQSA